MPESTIPAYITSLIRHFEDLRDGTHGGSAGRKDKEGHFERAVRLLAPIARQVLTEMNSSLLLDTGKLTETGLQRTEGWRAERILGFELARTAGSQGPANRAPSLLRRGLPSSPSSRYDRSGLAAERLQRGGCRSPAVHTPGHRVKRFAQFGLSRGLSDHPSGDSESRPARREKWTALSQANSGG
ncbi:MAG: hypothetical protein QOJ51_239 [Acidobacteriaceae bacterium]|jgi:hypothetical protein|nr:hypothetical protein [Acidobacteriaceae bacterium]